MSQGAVVADSVRSPALLANVVGEPPGRGVLVYLPPSYARRPERRYPVLYLLHGATSLPIEWVDGTYQGLDLRVVMDSLIETGAVPEFLVVMPDANSVLGAGFYVNSPATGGWEDFVVRDLVGYIDRRYRTVPRASERALAGHSMGGFGALALGFRHPDRFGLVYAMSPCCLAFIGRLDAASPQWRSLAELTRWQDAPPEMRLLLGFAAAIGGDPASPRLVGRLPFEPDAEGKLVSNAAVERRWLARMPADLATEMVRRKDRPPAVHLEAGSEEGPLRMGMMVLRRRLDSLGIRYVDTTFAGGHIDRVRNRVSGYLLPTVGRWFRRSSYGRGRLVLPAVR